MSPDERLVRAFAAAHPTELARLAEQLGPAALAEILDTLPPEAAAELLVRVMPLVGALALARLEPKSAAELLGELAPLAAASIALRLPHEERERLFAELGSERAAALRALIEYGPSRAGGRLDPTVPALPEATPIEEVLSRLRLAPLGALNYSYAVDATGKLTGVASLREMLAAAPEATLASIARRQPIALRADDPLETVATHPAWRLHHALPVVDRDGRLLGALRYSTFRAIEAEVGTGRGLTPTTETASALAELCALGVMAISQLAGATLGRERGPAPGANP